MQGAPHTSARHLTVIGAGPKAIAIAAKRQVLADQKILVPKLSVYDHKGLMAHWRGEHGYTDGQLPLGTPPEKDVGFPYASKDYDRITNRVINTEMLQFSWTAFHIQRERMSYADWIDRGKPSPQHRHWAEYLTWVAERVQLEVMDDCLTQIGLDNGRWQLSFSSGDTQITDALVITSPGPPRSKFEIKGESEWLFDGEDFWRNENQERFSKLKDQDPLRACVIGSGETAAAVVVQLTRLLRGFEIDVVSRGGIIYTRGESHEENRLYSDPENWLVFPPDVREGFVKRTDRGVFSVANKGTVNQTYGVKTVSGDVRCIEVSGKDLHLEFANREYSKSYNLIIDATGFQPDWFVKLMDGTAKDAFEKALDKASAREQSDDVRATGPKLPDDASATRIAEMIGRDLAIEDLYPRLHLPMFSAIRQGPGFPNLSCLGLLSDRILSSHCPPGEEQGVA